MQENGGLLDTLKGKESLKVEHIVTVPVATILYIVAGVTAAAALKKVFA